MFTFIKITKKLCILMFKSTCYMMYYFVKGLIKLFELFVSLILKSYNFVKRKIKESKFCYYCEKCHKAQYSLKSCYCNNCNSYMALVNKKQLRNLTPEELNEYAKKIIKEKVIDIYCSEEYKKNKETDPLYEECKNFTIDNKKVSASLLQKKFNLGYNRASNIIKQLESNNIISRNNNKGPWEVVIK